MPDIIVFLPILDDFSFSAAREIPDRIAPINIRTMKMIIMSLYLKISKVPSGSCTEKAQIKKTAITGTVKILEIFISFLFSMSISLYICNLNILLEFELEKRVRILDNHNVLLNLTEFHYYTLNKK